MKIRIEFEPGEGCGLSAIEIEKPVNNHDDLVEVISSIVDHSAFTPEQVCGSMLDFCVNELADAEAIVESIEFSSPVNFLEEAISKKRLRDRVEGNASPTGESSIH
jgi:hypothetical protein